MITDRKKYILSQMIKVKPIIEREGVAIHYSSKPHDDLLEIVKPLVLSHDSTKKTARLRNTRTKTNKIRYSD